MSFSPEDSRLKLTPAEEAHAKTLFHDELISYLHELELSKGLITLDNDPTYRIAVEQSISQAQPTRLSKTFVIDGQSYTVEGNSEAELQAGELIVMRGLQSNSAQGTPADQPARDSQGRFTARADNEDAALRAANDADLRAKLVTGQITPEEFLTQSNYMSEFLKTHYGLDAQSIANSREIDEWKRATNAFRANHPEWGDDYASAENQRRISQLLEENGMENGIDGDRLKALEEAFAFAKEHDLLVIPPTVQARKSISELNDLESIREAAKRAIGQPAAANLYENWRDSR